MNSIRNKELKEYINLLINYGFNKEKLSPESLPKSIALFANIFKKIERKASFKISKIETH